jgi:hypothetical protein
MIRFCIFAAANPFEWFFFVFHGGLFYTFSGKPQDGTKRKQASCQQTISGIPHHTEATSSKLEYDISRCASAAP